ncbi:MAG: DNA-3-methyladenine glycosylase [Coriobacteriia bacterium]|nr:DNA-3-methyladenine glycosylase [Coriobacteriia bacterium]
MTGSDPCGASKLPVSFFERPTEIVAPEVLGKILASTVGGVLTTGMIVECEAYLGARDAGSHAATKGITARNRVMYGPPGHLYVYFTYGNHHMLNLVTESEGVAGAVLVRAVEPLVGLEAMRDRRSGRSGTELTNGPGKVAQAFGIDLRHNGLSLGGEVSLYDAPPVLPDAIVTSGRIGLASGHELPLRFFLTGNAFVSKGRPGTRRQKG